MFRYRLTESLYKGVPTQTVATSEIQTDAMIDDRIAENPGDFYRYKMSTLVNLTGRYEEARLGDVSGHVSLKEIREGISEGLRTLKLFKASDGVPSFYVSGIEACPWTFGEGEGGRRELPEEFDLEDYIGKVENGFDVEMVIYFNAVRKMDMPRFVAKISRITDIIRRNVRAAAPMSRLAYGDFLYKDDKGSWRYLTDDESVPEFSGRMRKLYGEFMSSEAPSDSDPRQIMYERVVLLHKDDFMDAVRNRGVRIAREKYGFDLSVGEIDTDFPEFVDNLDKDSCCCRVSVSLKPVGEERKKFERQYIDDLIADCIVSLINPAFLHMVPVHMDVTADCFIFPWVFHDRPRFCHNGVKVVFDRKKSVANSIKGYIAEIMRVYEDDYIVTNDISVAIGYSVEN